MEDSKDKMLTELLFFEENFNKFSREERKKIILLLEKQFQNLEKKNLIVTLIDKINNL